MLNQELELSLNMAFARAREHRHEFMTVEHLLLARSVTHLPGGAGSVFCGFGCAPSGTGSLY